MKTKIIAIAVFVVVLILFFIGVRFRDRFMAPIIVDTNNTEELTTVQNVTEETTTADTQETKTPFVEAQTQIISGETRTTETATKEKPSAQLVTSAVKTWPKDELMNGIPKPDTLKISETLEYKTNQGKRFIIRFNSYSYGEFLAYVDRLEDAGFADNNNRYHIPETEPTGTAMFYYSYDGERSFGVYWHGEESMAGFDCEIVICNYDQAK